MHETAEGNISLKLVEFTFDKIAALPDNWFVNFADGGVFPIPEKPATNINSELPLAARSNASPDGCAITQKLGQNVKLMVIGYGLPAVLRRNNLKMSRKFFLAVDDALKQRRTTPFSLDPPLFFLDGTDFIVTNDYLSEIGRLDRSATQAESKRTVPA
ncbi:hypothetical protein HC766_08990 [Candidatus Gracilibacteria bacterium]|nr:hypothetical protein [Candidatus Gracilibacteria bacterium]